jgi:dTDP-4-dehydrorhamnose reductase
MRHETRHVVVTGAGGRLGGTLAGELTSAGHQVTGLRRSDLDITDVTQVKRTIVGLKPDAILNCTAYNAVDAAESEPGLAFAVNAHGPSALADAALEIGAWLVHYGTDFVFDGRTSEPYAEEAPTNPLSIYGASKLAGEQEVRRVPQHYILRVESLFGGCVAAGQRATIDYIADTLSADGIVRALVDRTVSPSSVHDVVRTTRTLIERGAPFGTYHCVASGCTTWYELAGEIARYLGVVDRVVPVSVDDVKTAAVRPRFCALSNRKLLALGVDLPTWQEALYDHLASRLPQVGMRSRLRARIA